MSLARDLNFTSLAQICQLHLRFSLLYLNFLFTINTLITFYICLTNPILTLLHTFDSINIVTENMNPVTPCLQLPCPPYHTDRQVDCIQHQTWCSQNSTDTDSRSPGIWRHTEWQIFTDVSEILATSIFRVQGQLSTHFHTTYGNDITNCNQPYYKYMRTLLARPQMCQVSDRV